MAGNLQLDDDAMNRLNDATDPSRASYPYGAFGAAQRDRTANGQQALGRLIQAVAERNAK